MSHYIAKVAMEDIIALLTIVNFVFPFRHNFIIVFGAKVFACRNFGEVTFGI